MYTYIFSLLDLPPSLVHMYHSFVIHSSVNGHLGCFHDLAIVHSAAVNTGSKILTPTCLAPNLSLLYSVTG